MPELWALATTLTLWFTRSYIAQQVKDRFFYPMLACWTTPRGRFWADNLEVLSRCPTCAGTYITLAVAWALHSPWRQVPVAYVCTVLTIAVYDALARLADLTLDEH